MNEVRESPGMEWVVPKFSLKKIAALPWHGRILTNGRPYETYDIENIEGKAMATAILVAPMVQVVVMVEIAPLRTVASYETSPMTSIL